MEFRIYYESLEQCLYYVRPILIESLKFNKIDNYKITLISKSQQSFDSKKNIFRNSYAKLISKILIKKNPDVIISVIKNGKEIPISIMEFSTAVFTKDHELQRADNFLPALNSNCIYIKISPLNKSKGDHGGDTNYDYVQPYAAFFQNYNELSFHINWETNINDSSFVQKHDIYKSIPSKSDKIIKLFNILIKTYVQNLDRDNWKHNLIYNVEQDKTFGEWVKEIRSYNKFEDIRKINSSRINWSDYNKDINSKNVFTLKFNRMGHAMDPERGMLSYYGTFFRKKDYTFVSKLIFKREINAWYKDTPNAKNIELLVNNGFNKKTDLIESLCFGLSLPNSKDLISTIDNDKKLIFDISNYVSANFYNFNNAFKNIIENSDFLYLSNDQGNEIYLKWENIDISKLDEFGLPECTEIIKRTNISEDDITFATMHNLFQENKILPISVSYPGAQSDTPILPTPGEGEKQLRVYIDSIGLKDELLYLQENKGRFREKEVSSDYEKIIKFKYDKAYITALNQFKIENNIKFIEVVIGLGFGYSEAFAKKIGKSNFFDIDYLLIVNEDLSSWKIFSSSSKKIFDKMSGKIIFPETYEVLKNKSNKDLLN